MTTDWRLTISFAVVAVFAAALVAARCVCLSTFSRLTSFDPELHSNVLDAAEDFAFDRNAKVLLCVGDDQRPGQANYDDNMNGEVDEPGELGAVHSDDRLLAPGDDMYSDMLDGSGNRVMFLGAFVPVRHLGGPVGTGFHPAEFRTRVRLTDEQQNPRSWMLVKNAAISRVFD